MINPERAAHCASCRSAIPPDAPVYTLRVDLFASATPPEFDDRDMVEDTSDEWARLLAQMAAMDAKAASEESAKVWERYEFALCEACRQRYHEQLKRLQR